MLGAVKTSDTVRIPAKTFMKFKGKTRFKIDTSGEKDVLFSPMIHFEGEHDLIVYDS